MKQPSIRDVLAALVFTSVGLCAASCSALLDTEKLQQGTPDGDVPEDSRIKDSEPGDGQVDGEPYAAALHLFAPRATFTKELQVNARAPGQRTASFTFRWEGLPGRPVDTDLALTVEGSTPLLQIFARDGRPFLRAGLNVRPLSPGVSYQLDLTLREEPLPPVMQVALQRLDGVTGREELSICLAAQAWPAALLLALNAADHDRYRVVLSPTPENAPLKDRASRRGAGMAIAALR